MSLSLAKALPRTRPRHNGGETGGDMSLPLAKVLPRSCQGLDLAIMARIGFCRSLRKPCQGLDLAIMAGRQPPPPPELYKK